MASITPYLQVEHLSKSVGNKRLFEDISFGINRGDRIALVARNGIGKSTLLDILMGKTDYDEGRITWRRDLRVHYLEQTPPVQAGEEHLSGGQRKRLAIERVLADEPDLIILDEPTNHLDLEYVIKLEETLSKSNLTILMVTHDRYFLDHVCTDIIEMDRTTLYTYHGNYSYYLEKRAERLEQMNAETEKARNLYRTELDWMRRMPQARAHKAQYRIDNFYELEKKARGERQEADVKLDVQSGYIGNKIFEAKNVCKAFDNGGKVILQDFNYVFSRYEKLGIIGNNGTGKSTFVKLLLGELSPDSGCFDIGTTVRFGYYSQQGIHIDEGKKVIDVVRDIAETVETGDGRLTASQLLQQFLFSPDQQYDYVEKLSGGEKRRLYLCTVLMKSPNFLVLDEPTNDLDIQTLQVLEAYLRAFKGCLIVISHDRYFMDKVVDHLFVFKGEGQINDFPGNYTQWRNETYDAPEAEDGESKKKQKNDWEKGERVRRLSFKEKQELSELEQRLPALEEEKRALEEGLSGLLTTAEEIAAASKRYDELKDELDAAELRWLELSEIA